MKLISKGLGLAKYWIGRVAPSLVLSQFEWIERSIGKIPGENANQICRDGGFKKAFWKSSRGRHPTARMEFEEVGTPDGPKSVFFDFLNADDKPFAHGTTLKDDYGKVMLTKPELKIVRLDELLRNYEQGFDLYTGLPPTSASYKALSEPEMHQG